MEFVSAFLNSYQNDDMKTGPTVMTPMTSSSAVASTSYLKSEDLHTFSVDFDPTPPPPALPLATGQPLLPMATEEEQEQPSSSTPSSSTNLNSKKRGRKKKSPDEERHVIPFSRTWERAKMIYDFYLQHGTKASAQHFNMSYGYIQVLVHKYRKYSNDTRSRVRGLRLPKEEKKQVYDYYLAHGYDETAKQFNYSKLFVYNLIRYYKSKLREEEIPLPVNSV